MKTLDELERITKKEKSEGKKVIAVGMATCGISAGARPVLNAFVEEVSKEGLTDKVMVTQTGCIGICQYEPVVEVFEDGKDKVTYVKMTAEKAKKVAEQHLKNGKIVSEYVITETKA